MVGDDRMKAECRTSKEAAAREQEANLQKGNAAHSK